MDMKKFITVGENIHCTRIVMSGGSRTDKLSSGGEGVVFRYKGERLLLPIPANWAQISPPYAEGKIRHIALAVRQALEGASAEERELGEAYLLWAAERQTAKNANFLDVNVDEYTNDPKTRVQIMAWLAGFLSQRVSTPLSIDSSNVDTLVAGLKQCRPGVSPMINSVSMEREEAVDVVVQFGADAVVSAAAKAGLPQTVDERMKNFEEIVSILQKKGVALEKMHLDPLVFPISVDPMNGKGFFEATAAAKKRFNAANITGGLSNISFGMPNRKLLNMVFTWLFVEAGGNGGIIDPVQMPPEEIASLDPDSESFKLARAVLDGTDMFGGDYIAAFRDGKMS